MDSKLRYINEIVVLDATKPIDIKSAQIYISTFITLKKEIANSNPKGVFISLNRIPQNDLTALEYLIINLAKVKKELGVDTGICDYDSAVYKILKINAEKHKIKLFNNVYAAILFLNPASLKRSLNILIYDNDPESKKIISAEILGLGYSVTMANSIEEFNKLANSKESFDVIISEIFAGIDFYEKTHDGSILLNTIEGYVDSRIYNQYGHESLVKKIGKNTKVLAFDVEKMSMINSQGINFFTVLAKKTEPLGVKVCLVGLNTEKMNKGFLEELKKNHVVFTSLPAADTGKKLKLSKLLIMNLASFVDTAVETMITLTGLEAKKDSHYIESFNVEGFDNKICATMVFEGDIGGVFVLIFPNSLAKIAIESMLGESVDENDADAIQDGVAEFCNIITGSTKTAMDKKELSIKFQLPKTYTSVHEAMESIGNNQGIWINLQLGGDPFYIFLTSQ